MDQRRTSNDAVGYSGTPQQKKLGIKPGTRLMLDHAPTGWSLMAPLDSDVVDVSESPGVVLAPSLQMRPTL